MAARDTTNQNIYNLDYQQAGNLLTPPSKRNPNWLAFLNACLYPIQWLRDKTFGDYANGSDAALYSNIATYRYGQRVVWTDFGIWEQIYAPNNVPTNITGQAPGGDNNPYWYKIQNNILGVRLRSQITGQNLPLEYYLNTLFSRYGSTFTNPTNYGTGTYPDGTTSSSTNPYRPAIDYFPRSSIFIITNPIERGVFVVANSDAVSSSVLKEDIQRNQNNVVYNSTNQFASLQYNFTIYVPNAVLASINSTTANAAKTVYDFASIYGVYGLIFKIQGY